MSISKKLGVKKPEAMYVQDAKKLHLKYSMVLESLVVSTVQIKSAFPEEKTFVGPLVQSNLELISQLTGASGEEIFEAFIQEISEKEKREKDARKISSTPPPDDPPDEVA